MSALGMTGGAGTFGMAVPFEPDAMYMLRASGGAFPVAFWEEEALLGHVICCSAVCKASLSVCECHEGSCHGLGLCIRNNSSWSSCTVISSWQYGFKLHGLSGHVSSELCGRLHLVHSELSCSQPMWITMNWLKATCLLTPTVSCDGIFRQDLKQFGEFLALGPAALGWWIPASNHAFQVALHGLTKSGSAVLLCSHFKPNWPSGHCHVYDSVTSWRPHQKAAPRLQA